MTIPQTSEFRRQLNIRQAAPDLLAALQAILRAHEAPSGASIGEAALCPMFADLARDAIAKATS